jgi:cytochrome c oxidase subunit II
MSEIKLRRLPVWLLGMLLLAGSLSACGTNADGWFARSGGEEFSSNGERIYFTATNESGDRVRSSAGPRSGMMRDQFACADCHGDDGQGGQARMMMESFEAPAITWDSLTGEHGDHGVDGHPPYDEESLKRAIRDGVDPEGNRLDSLMPRWEISDSDVDDLIEFLKSLEGDDDH